MDDRTLEPLKAYKESYAKEFLTNTEAFFDSLVKESGLNIAENRTTVKKYSDKIRYIEETKRHISNLSALQGFLIFLICLGFLLAIIGVYVLATNGKVVIGAVLLPVGVVFVILGFSLIFAVTKPRLASLKKEKDENINAAEALKSLAYKQMLPLNTLFDDNMTKKIIEKTIPILQIDDNFGMRRYDYLQNKYGYDPFDDNNRSTIGILTGEILGNPFVIDRQFIHNLGTQTYSGSLLITWTETHYDSEGHAHTVHNSQTLYAQVVKPKPFYHSETRLIYGNEAAPDLHFSRKPCHAEDMSEKQIEKKIKVGVKKIRSKQENKVGFTEMGNEEFDVLFGALDRDNEVQFRLLFTPLAQKNMLSLIMDSNGYGDDFTMIKAGCLNYISSEHSIGWDPDTNPSKFYSYSHDISRRNFIDFNVNYFRSLYFDFAPLLSIPLYQQHKPKEYIYKDFYERNYTRHETEYAVNNLGGDAFASINSSTPSILKTRLVSTDGKSDKVCVTAYSYRTVNRVDFVPVLGGDGHLHEVPVPWVEYIPVSNEKTVMLKELGLSKRCFEENCEIKDKIKNRSIDGFSYGHGILCCITDNDSDFDSDFNINKK